jgi:hypothetical protein
MSTRTSDNIASELSVEQDATRKRVYEAPRLAEWGKIADLTAGTGNGFFDSNFTGSTGT